MLDLPPGTVRSRIARGRAALAAALGGNRPAAPERPTPTASEPSPATSRPIPTTSSPAPTSTARRRPTERAGVEGDPTGSGSRGVLPVGARRPAVCRPGRGRRRRVERDAAIGTALAAAGTAPPAQPSATPRRATDRAPLPTWVAPAGRWPSRRPASSSPSAAGLRRRPRSALGGGRRRAAAGSTADGRPRARAPTTAVRRAAPGAVTSAARPATADRRRTAPMHPRRRPARRRRRPQPATRLRTRARPRPPVTDVGTPTTLARCRAARASSPTAARQPAARPVLPCRAARPQRSMRMARDGAGLRARSAPTGRAVRRRGPPGCGRLGDGPTVRDAARADRLPPCPTP